MFDGKGWRGFALEVSRLARSNLDWHRLLELCALTDTLVIDEDVATTGRFQRWPVIGLEGTMAKPTSSVRGRSLWQAQ